MRQLLKRAAHDACTAKGSCYVCVSRHHSKLHSDDQINHAIGSRTSGTGGQYSAVHFTASELTQPAVEPCGNQQLLATAIVVLQSEEGVRITAKALLDSCAERSFVSQDIAQALALKRNPITVAISGLNGTTSAIACGEVQLTLKSLINPNFNLDVTAFVVKCVSTLLPRDRVFPGDWAHIQGLQLADPHFGRPSRVDCILSSAGYGAVMLPEICRGQPPHLGPVAMSSIFGWILVGYAGSGQPTTRTSVRHLAVDHSLSEAVAKFWESEEVPQKQRMTPPPEQECWEHFESTYRRNAEARFIVRLPFCKEPAFVSSDQIARSCMIRLERSFEQHPELASAYYAFMQEHLDLGHMVVVPPEELDLNDGYFLPYHPVFKQDGSKKIRVVFNGSLNDESGNSLKAYLHPGPKLQEDIVVIITR